MWYERRVGAHEFREAPERLAHDKREPTWGWQTDKTLSFNAYLLSSRAAAAVLWQPDVSANAEPLRKRWLAPRA